MAGDKQKSGLTARKVFFAAFAVLLGLELLLRLLGLGYNLFHRPPQPAPGPVVTIFCLGESTTGGLGVDPRMNYPSQLERMLNAGREQMRYRVIHDPKLGANSSMMLRQLPEAIETYQPDIVVAMIGINNWWNLDRSNAILFNENETIANLATRAYVLLHRLRIFKLAKITYYAVADPKVTGTWEPQDQPPTDSRLALANAVLEDDLTRIVRQARESGVAVMISGYPTGDCREAHQRVAGATRAPFVDNYPVFQALGDPETVDGYFIKPGDAHPNADGYTVLAKNVYEELVAQMLVDPAPTDPNSSEVPLQAMPYPVDPAWAAEPWLRPNPLAVPTDVVVTPQGFIYVAEAWDTISRIDKGKYAWNAVNAVDYLKTEAEEKARVYSLASDHRMHLWGYNFAEGVLLRVVVEEDGQLLAAPTRYPELQTPFESTIEADREGKVWLGVNRPDSTGKAKGELIRYDAETGKLKIVGEFDEEIRALALDELGLGAIALGDRLLRWNSRTGAIGGQIAECPEKIAYNSLLVSGEQIFAASGAWKEAGTIYRISQDQCEPEYTHKGAGFQGLAWNNGEILATVRRSGELLRISATDGKPTQLIQGNGTTIHQMLAWANGRLLVNDAESGRILSIDPESKVVAKLAETITYSYLGAKMAVDEKSGDLMFAINAPGFEKKQGVVRISLSDGTVDPVGLDKSIRPGSVAVAADGSVFVTDLQKDGRVLQIHPSDKPRVLAANLPFPIGLSTGPGSSLYVAVTQTPDEEYEGVPLPDAVLVLEKDNDTPKLALSVTELFDFAVSAEGCIYAGTGREVRRSCPPFENPKGKVFAKGFSQTLGMTFDPAGNLYVSDAETGAIWRFLPARMD
jgi:lysophospholipase L1-like esterase/DNA-binding beta-propeller fold protein YncE